MRISGEIRVSAPFPLHRLFIARNRSAGDSNVQYAQTIALRVLAGRMRIDDGKCGASSNGGGEADLWLANGSGHFFRPHFAP